MIAGEHEGKYLMCNFNAELELPTACADVDISRWTAKVEGVTIRKIFY